MRMKTYLIYSNVPLIMDYMYRFNRFVLREFWDLWVNTYEFVCCYNRCHCNGVKTL
jgi:hypothetical protein